MFRVTGYKSLILATHEIMTSLYEVVEEEEMMTIFIIMVPISKRGGGGIELWSKSS